MTVTTLDAALWLVARGFPVFPADHPGTRYCTGIGRGHDPKTCIDRGKHPCVRFSTTYATDERQVQRAFDGRLRNVAVPVGKVPGPDGAQLLVIDSDRPDAIEDTAAALGEQWLPTMRVTTAKGYHDYLWAPGDAPLGLGLGALRGKFDGDVRAGNAYVIGPGSVHASGVVYEPVDPEQPPVPAPGWLLDALTSRPAPTPGPVRRPGAAAPVRRRSATLTGLVKYVLDSREGQRPGRNERLYWAAQKAFKDARQRGLDLRAVEDAMFEAATYVGLGEAEARHAIKSACNARNAR
ncbi:bifunctional DNA primase/polymerase [Streptomyces sp. S07_1.15]|uniref:bifunctional DNA primase/polymerase n=1 Tax=Streptomyces sp. S07_1.15 TaxID=2873925 RepID=UPI001D1376F3|nr:bifunctional DNA primase/polymerase [Streptomyces sp. S07_1.15]MCC3653217.1 bifunctional DNA primase/polymerase [Streptomyces sp. S07_1.15]